MTKPAAIEVHVGKSQITWKMLEDAGADANHLMENGPIISKLVGIELIAQQLFLLLRSALEGEVTTNWDIEQPDLVVRTLGMSAERFAFSSPITAVQMKDLLLLNVIPVIEAFCQMEEDDAAAERTG